MTISIKQFIKLTGRKNMAKIKLGDEVRDTVTGFHGIAVSKHQYMTGCARISVQPPVDKDGKVPDQYSFDEPMLEVVKKEKKKAKPSNKGGPAGFIPPGKSTGN